MVEVLQEQYVLAYVKGRTCCEFIKVSYTN